MELEIIAKCLAAGVIILLTWKFKEDKSSTPDGARDAGNDDYEDDPA